MPRLATRRHILSGPSLAVTSCLLTVCALEIGLRRFPRALPRGTYTAVSVDPRTGLSGHRDEAIYNRGSLVRRAANDDGFLDLPHRGAKHPGTRRVAFYGDSYVEAVQVPLDQTFFRLVEAGAKGGVAPQAEILAFGISGWGTVHSLMAFRYFNARYHIDTACYVFVENDPGDNVHAIRARTAVGGWGAMLTAYEPGWALQAPPPSSPSMIRRGLRFLRRHSLVSRLVTTRSALLLWRGVKIEEDRAARQMTTHATGIPDANDLPSTWPPAWRNEAEELTRRVLTTWRDEARAGGVELFAFYVPRGEAQLTGEIPDGQTWHPWFRQLCRNLEIPLVDPTGDMAAAHRAGGRIYEDHWTPLGHEVAARVLTEYALRGLRNE